MLFIIYADKINLKGKAGGRQEKSSSAVSVPAGKAILKVSDFLFEKGKTVLTYNILQSLSLTVLPIQDTMMKYLRYVFLPFPAMEFLLPDSGKKFLCAAIWGVLPGSSSLDTVRIFSVYNIRYFQKFNFFRKSTRIQPLERQKTAGTAAKLTRKPCGSPPAGNEPLPWGTG